MKITDELFNLRDHRVTLALICFDNGIDDSGFDAELIRDRPLAAIGMAFAAGWIISKLGRSEK